MKSELPGAQSSHWTIAVSGQRFTIALALLLLVQFILAASVPLAEDEIYYWSWSQHLGPSYFDHPPLVAYLIAISSGIFGKSAFGIRFFSPLIAAFTLWNIRRVTGQTGIVKYLLLTPVFFLGAILITPDAPLVLFWFSYVVWLIRINDQLNQWTDDPVSRVYHKTPVNFLEWGILGVLLGLGLLGKYTMALVVPCSFIALLSRHRVKGWISGWVLHGVVGFIFFLPVIYFNYRHQFVSFLFQWGNALEGTHALSLKRGWEFLASQILLVGALPLLLLPWALGARRSLSDNGKFHICFYFYVIPFVFFFLNSFRTKLEANWGIVAYLSFWPIAQQLLDRNSFKQLGRLVVLISFLVPIGLTGVVLVHLIHPLPQVPPRTDRLTRMRSLLDVSKNMAKEIRAVKSNLPVYAATYQWTAYLLYQDIPAKQLYPAGRMSQFTLDKKLSCEEPALLVVTENPDSGAAFETLKCFPKHRVLVTLPMQVRGTDHLHLSLIEYTR